MEFVNIGPVGGGGVGGGKSLNKEEERQIIEFRVAMTCSVHAPTKGQYSTTRPRPRQTCIDSGSLIRSSQPIWIPPLASEDSEHA